MYINVGAEYMKVSCIWLQIQELDKLQRQLESTTDEKKKKPLQEQMRLTKAKKELANSKAVR